MQWYYTVDGQREGPLDDARLEELVRQGVIRDETLVWHEGAAGWEPWAAIRAKRSPAPPPAAASVSSTMPTAATLRPAVPLPAAPMPRSRSSPPEKLLFYYPVLRALSNGQVIQKLVIWALKILSILVCIGALGGFILILKGATQMPGAATLGGVLFAIIFLATMACVAQVYWYRAASVEQLGESPFTVIPIVSILFRMGGEIYATLGVGLGVGAALAICITGTNPLGALGGFGSMIPSIPVEGGLLGGLLILVYACVMAFLALVISYFLAEAIVVMVDIARYLRKLVEKEQPHGTTP